MSLLRSALAPLATGLLGLSGCLPADAPPEGGSWPAWDRADLVETEPNDDVPQDLGRISLNFSLAGRSDSCGRDGSWAGADVDLFAFAFDDDAMLRLRLRAEGADLDLDLFDPAGDLLAELDRFGTDDEVIDVSLEAGAIYTVRIRCWLGNDDRWVLAMADRGD